MVWILFYGSIIIKNNYTALGSSHFQKCHYHNCWIHLKRNTKVIHLHYGGIGCKLWFQKSFFLYREIKQMYYSGLLQNSLSSDDTSLTPPTDEKSLVSGPLQPSVLMQAVLWDQQQWQTFSGKSLCRFKYAKGLWFAIYGELSSHRSLPHHFLGDSCPEGRQQKQLCDGSQPLHFRLWYSYSYHLTKTVQADVLGYEPRKLGSHNIPYPELRCVH